jgi:hypothetical protein
MSSLHTSIHPHPHNKNVNMVLPELFEQGEKQKKIVVFSLGTSRKSNIQVGSSSTFIFTFKKINTDRLFRSRIVNSDLILRSFLELQSTPCQSSFPSAFQEMLQVLFPILPLYLPDTSVHRSSPTSPCFRRIPFRTSARDW